MKLLFFCDVHADNTAINNLINKSKKEKVDAIICAGDLSNFGVGLTKLVKRFDIGTPFYMIPGNHETDKQIKELDSKFKWFHNLHLKAIKIGDKLVVGCGGGGFSQKHTPFEKSEKYFREELEKFKDLEKAIVVTHAPPYKTRLDLINGHHTGVKSLRKFIEKEQPGIVICGHLHENEGKEDYIKETRIINPGKKGIII